VARRKDVRVADKGQLLQVRVGYGAGPVVAGDEGVLDRLVERVAPKEWGHGWIGGYPGAPHAHAGCIHSAKECWGRVDDFGPPCWTGSEFVG
jgi:hypothetical protein